MWRDEDELIHTVSIPDPSAHFSDDFLAQLTSAKLSERRRLLELLEDLEDETVDEIDELPLDLAEEGAFSEQEIPESEILDISTAGDWHEATVRALLAVPIRWRLDFVLALGDLVDDE